MTKGNHNNNLSSSLVWWWWRGAAAKNYFPTKPRLLPAYYDKKTRFHLYMKRKKRRERRTKILQCWCCFSRLFQHRLLLFLIHTNLLLVDGGSLSRAYKKLGFQACGYYSDSFWHGNNLIFPFFCTTRDKCQLFPPKHIFSLLFSVVICPFCEKLFHMNEFFLLVTVVIAAEVWRRKIWIKYLELFLAR